MKLERLITIQELSQIIAIKVPTIYRWVHEEYIPHLKINHLVRFKESEIAEWIEKKNCKGRNTRVPEINLENKN
jgi:excisionase family DNA binding protein